MRRELQNQPLKARRAMDAVGGFLNGKIKDLVPVDEGFLTADISNSTVLGFAFLGEGGHREEASGNRSSSLQELDAWAKPHFERTRHEFRMWSQN